MLVDARFVGESVAPDHRLVGLHAHPGERTEQLARRVDELGVDAGLERIDAGSHMQRHDDLFERGIAGALADAVDGALDLQGAPFDRGERIGDGEAQIVVAVGREGDLVDAAHAGSDASRTWPGIRPGVEYPTVSGRLMTVAPSSTATWVAWMRNSRSVRVASSGLNSTSLQHMRASRVALAIFSSAVLRSMPSLCSRCRSLVLRKMWMRPRRRCFETPRTSFDVALGTAGEGGDGRVLDLARDGLHAGEIFGARGGEPGLDDVDAQRLELLGEPELLGGGHPVAGRLFAVSQRGVEDKETFHASSFASSTLPAFVKRARGADGLLCGAGEVV